MTLNISFPKDEIPIDYLASFAIAFKNIVLMHDALLGAQDSLRQANLIKQEPLGYLALITAEEEAASFLYYALREKGYAVPDHGKIQRHTDKVKMLLFAEVMMNYFFANFPLKDRAIFRIMRENDLPVTSLQIPINNYYVSIDDPLSTIFTVSNDETTNKLAIDKSVELLLEKYIDKGSTLKKCIDDLANRRNLSLYGNPTNKYRIHSESEIKAFQNNCIVMIALGFMVFNSNKCTDSMIMLVEIINKKFQLNKNQKS